jgi:hypothetical protein
MAFTTEAHDIKPLQYVAMPLTAAAMAGILAQLPELPDEITLFHDTCPTTGILKGLLICAFATQQGILPDVAQSLLFVH